MKIVGVVAGSGDSVFEHGGRFYRQNSAQTSDGKTMIKWRMHVGWLTDGSKYCYECWAAMSSSGELDVLMAYGPPAEPIYSDEGGFICVRCGEPVGNEHWMYGVTGRKHSPSHRKNPDSPKATSGQVKANPPSEGEKEAFRFFFASGAVSKERYDQMMASWEAVTKKWRVVGDLGDLPPRARDSGNFSTYEQADGEISAMKKDLKGQGFTVRTKTTGFGDLARSDLIQLVAIRPRSGWKVRSNWSPPEGIAAVAGKTFKIGDEAGVYTVDRVDSQRNGISGESFHQVTFHDETEHYIGVVFPEKHVVAVVTPNNPHLSWRGDNFEPALRGLIADWEAAI